MEKKDITKTYSNGEITVEWKPAKCIHSGICVESLPNVYKPNEKPWIQAGNATTEELKAQIAKCPSGALGYRMNNGEDPVAATEEIKVQVLANGPLLVHGALKVTDTKGQEELKTKTTAFCRCGASENKPYCDGTHSKIDFKDA